MGQFLDRKLEPLGPPDAFVSHSEFQPNRPAEGPFTLMESVVVSSMAASFPCHSKDRERLQILDRHG